METKNSSVTSGMKFYKVVLTFDSVLKGNQQVLVYDPCGHMAILDGLKNNNRQSYNFKWGSGSKELVFYVEAKQGDLFTGEHELEACKFKIQHIRD